MSGKLPTEGKSAAALPWLVQGPGYSLLLGFLAALLLVVALLAASVGPYHISYLHLFGLIRDWLGGEPLSQVDKTTLAVFFHIRLARILLAGLVGMGLAWPARRSRASS
jgi:ABC-type Fe3+-siderophore transport system permease subunit